MTRKDINLIAEAYGALTPGSGRFDGPIPVDNGDPVDAITDFKDRQKYVALRKMEQQALTDSKRLKDFKKTFKLELADRYRDQALEILNKYIASEDDESNVEQLQIGIEVEKEHTDDESLAEKIARDHLAEDPHYYTKLKKAGL
jgi:hypothetical protein